MIACDVLAELGVIEPNVSSPVKAYKVIQGVKVDLNNSQILKKLKEG